MIRITNTGSGPSRELTPDEKATVIASQITEQDYIYFQNGDQSSQDWTNFLASQKPTYTQGELSAIQIARYKDASLALITEVNILNTSAGLTAEQSSDVENMFDGVYRAIERGYFPLALGRIALLEDTGIVYESKDLRQHWTELITRYRDEYRLSF